MNKNVIARFKVKSNEIENFKSLAETLISNTRKEEGCSIYKLFQEITDDKNEFLFYEIYNDDAALEVHKKSDYLSGFIKEISEYLMEDPTIEVHSL
ncbi:antibiotic biosynthesis monooxygenase [Weeksellaceae bacterium TAE3-ERU29]|nr:antibiotic biosynthesis monooxygenase [Weeksellaceae bacterium TAE3-ERU29]